MSADLDRAIAQYRVALDATNDTIRALLQSRAALVRQVVAHKRSGGLAIVDEAREREMLVRVRAAPGEGFSPDALERIFAVIFAESRRLALSG